jgi:hypothetical protein
VDYFDKSLTAVNQLSVVFYVAYIMFSLTASWVIHEKGLMSGLIWGAIFTIAGAWLRYIVTVVVLDPTVRFYITLLAQARIFSCCTRVGDWRDWTALLVECSHQVCSTLVHSNDAWQCQHDRVHLHAVYSCR